MTLAVNFTPLADGRVAALERAVGDSVNDAISHGLDAIAGEARANVVALRDPGSPSPSPLANSIRSELNADGMGGVVRAGDAVAPYAVFVEFGTARIPAQPFLSPAFAVWSDRIQADLAAAVGAGIGGRT